MNFCKNDRSWQFQTMKTVLYSGTLPVIHLYMPLLPTLLDMESLLQERDGKITWLIRNYIDASPTSDWIGFALDLGQASQRQCEFIPAPDEESCLPGNFSPYNFVIVQI